MTNDAHRILCTDLTRLISPCEVIRVYDIPTRCFYDEWGGSIRKHKVFRSRIQRAFLPRHCEFLPLLAKQGHGNGLEQGPLVLFKQARLLGLNLPLNSRTLRLSNSKIRDRGISLMNDHRVA